MLESQLIKNQMQLRKHLISNFTTIGPKLAEKIETQESDGLLKYSALSETSKTPCFEFQPIDLRTIEADTKKLKCSKSAGWDKVSVKLLKDAAKSLSKPLAAIYNSSFEMALSQIYGRY